MAFLELLVGYFELKSKEINPSSEWIEVALVLSIEIEENKFVLENLKKLSIQKTDIKRLVEGVREFVSSRIQADNAFESVVKVYPFEFVPIELGFLFGCLEGEVDENLNGEITVRILINLDLINQNFTASYLGGEFNVDAQKLLRFITNLEGELLRIDSIN